MENIIEKNKYFIYNEDYKILIFVDVRYQKLQVFLPNEVNRENQFEINKNFSDLINKILINNENLCHLKTDISDSLIYNSENYKLKKETLRLIKNYYSCYKEFSKQELDKIICICNEYNVLPYFVTIEELKQLIDETSFHYIDIKMKEPLEELDKRLKYIKY